MSSAADRDIMPAFYAALDRGDREGLFALLDPAFTARMQGTGRAMDAAEYWAFVDVIREPLKSFIHRCDAVVADGSRVAVQGTLLAVHSAELFGMPASGKAIDVPFVTVVKLNGGKIQDMVALMDTQLLLSQISGA